LHQKTQPPLENLSFWLSLFLGTALKGELVGCLYQSC
jgi:hypothetical protein